MAPGVPLMVALTLLPEQIVPVGINKEAVGNGITFKSAGIFKTLIHDGVPVVATLINTKCTAAVKVPGILKIPEAFKVMVSMVLFCE